MTKLWRGIIFATILEGGAVVLILWLCHVLHLNQWIVLGISTGLILAYIQRSWLASKERRNADLATALARGTGTYIIGGREIPKNFKPINERLGIPLAGVQPGAVPRNPDSGMPIITKVQTMPTDPGMDRYVEIRPDFSRALDDDI